LENVIRYFENYEYKPNDKIYKHVTILPTVNLTIEETNKSDQIKIQYSIEEGENLNSWIGIYEENEKFDQNYIEF
jgi:hypothetical protein